MKGDMLIKMGWVSSDRLNIWRVGYGPVRKPFVIKVEKMRKNWDLKIGGRFFVGYPGQNIVFDRYDTFEGLFGRHFPLKEFNPIVDFSCLKSEALRNFLKLRVCLRKVKTVEEVELLLKKMIKNVYWGEHGFSYMFSDLFDCLELLPKRKTFSKISLGKGVSKKYIILLEWSVYRLQEQQLPIRKTIFLEHLKRAYSGEYLNNDQINLFSLDLPLQLLGFYMFSAEDLVEKAKGIYEPYDRFFEAGIPAATWYYPADGDELRKIADWLAMAGVERKKNGVRQKWTVEEECFFNSYTLSMNLDQDYFKANSLSGRATGCGPVGEGSSPFKLT